MEINNQRENTQKVVVRNSSLTGAEFENCRAEEVTFRNTSLPNFRVECADLSEARFKDVNMSRMLITDANLSDLEIDGAQLGGAFIHNIGLPTKGHPAYREDQGRQRPLRFEMCELAGSTIASSDLSGVHIERCNIEGLTIDGIDVSKLLKRYQAERQSEGKELQEEPPQLTPLLKRSGAAFVPVRDIEKARDWYCRMMGIPAESVHVMNGHLCSLPVEGSGIILDTMPMWGGQEPGGPPTFKTPAFTLLTDDLAASYAFMKEHGVELVTPIEHDHWFAFRDPDGNLLMVCKA
ncbi:pentapeptide repeat protein [Paenibacillus sp. BK033]|uniref:VOC family protein n=1 Tax=Paenibacillus sp. BK033 TaxID=2512133 RepID=UPI001045FE8B|nr:pentapeptide repeat protein [Paenibacillus sp. BK033]